LSRWGSSSWAAPQAFVDSTPYDDSDWPIVRVRPPPPRSEAEVFRRHLGNIGLAFARKQPFGLLVDARGFPPLSPTERRMVAERVRENQVASGGLLKGIGVVMDSRMGRGILTAIQWIARPMYPMAAFETESDARRWLRELLVWS
jgi:hypothetical protein